MSERLDLSILLVSYNTAELLRRCLAALAADTAGGDWCEALVIDNASRDASADLVAREFPAVHLQRSATNLGFAAANNRLLAAARGRYVLLLNPDACPRPGVLRRAVALMDAHPRAGAAGGRLVDPTGAAQPSARCFPSTVNDLLTLSGLAARYPRSRWFGRFDRTWADPHCAARVDWIPGAFTILRRDLLERLGGFDERFFLYYEEVDLCRRIAAAGAEVWYWPELEIEHIGGASSRAVAPHAVSRAGSQLTLWRMRSALLYHRKHHGVRGAWSALASEGAWHALRACRHAGTHDTWRRMKHDESTRQLQLLRQAWLDTAGGRLCPPRPW